MKVVLLGATKGIGRAVSRLLAERGDQIFLLGRDLEDLERTARDLEVRSGHDPASTAEQAAQAVPAVQTALCDLADETTFEAALEEADQALGGFDCLIVTAAQFASQERLESDPRLTRQLLHVNFTQTVLLCELAKRRLLERGGGRLCVVSSVAGERGRKPVVLYGASKAGLSAYLEGLDHKHYADGLRVLDVKPGFVKTSMTAGLKPPPFAGEPQQVARDIVRALDRSTPVVYTPWIWRWVLLVIRNLPRFVMRRIGF